MLEDLLQLSDSQLLQLVERLGSGRLTPPYGALQLEAGLRDRADSISRGLRRLADAGLSPAAIASLLRSVVDDRQRRVAATPTELVMSGPEVPGVSARDTGVVVRELFRGAERSVMLIGFAIHQGQRVLAELAERMRALPDLAVECYFNIGRGYQDTTITEDLVARFMHRFRTEHWPDDVRLPVIYYDLRALSLQMQERASLHAKCVVVDESQVLITSANFTTAAQRRNIEVGLRLEQKRLADQLVSHFRGLRDQGVLIRAR